MDAGRRILEKKVENVVVLTSQCGTALVNFQSWSAEYTRMTTVYV